MKKIKLTEFDLIYLIKKIILEEKDFTEYKYKKPSFFNKFKKGFKDLHSIESKQDRETLYKVIERIKNPPYDGFISNIRMIGNETIAASIGNNTLVVDCNPQNPEIRFKGNNLDLNNIEFECQLLFNILKHRM